MSKGPLDGIRIIELAGLGALPFGSLQARRHGRGHRARRTASLTCPAIARRRRHSAWDRGRRSIAVDLKHPDGRRDRAAPRRPGRRVPRIVPTRRDRTTRPRPRRRAWPATRASSTGASPAGASRARSPRPPATRSTTKPSPASSARSVRRAGRPCRCCRSSATSPAAVCSLAYGVVCALLEAQRIGQGPGRRRGDGRRHDVAARARTTAWPQSGCTPTRWPRTSSTAARRSTTCTRRPTASTCRVAPIEPHFYALLLDKMGLAGEALPGQYDRAQWPVLRARSPTCSAPRRATNGARCSKAPTPASRRCSRSARRARTRTTSRAMRSSTTRPRSRSRPA